LLSNKFKYFQHVKELLLT